MSYTLKDLDGEYLGLDMLAINGLFVRDRRLTDDEVKSLEEQGVHVYSVRWKDGEDVSDASLEKNEVLQDYKGFALFPKKLPTNKFGIFPLTDAGFIGEHDTVGFYVSNCARFKEYIK